MFSTAIAFRKLRLHKEACWKNLKHATTKQFGETLQLELGVKPLMILEFLFFWPWTRAIKYTIFDQPKRKCLKRNKNITEKGSSPETLSALSTFMLGATSKEYRQQSGVRSWFEQQTQKMMKPTKLPRSPIKQDTVFFTLFGTEKGCQGSLRDCELKVLKIVLSSILFLMIQEKIPAGTWVLILAVRKYLLLTESRLKKAQKPEHQWWSLVSSWRPLSKIQKCRIL